MAQINALGKLITLLPKSPVDEGDSVSSKAEAIEKLNRILEEHLPAPIEVDAEATPVAEETQPEDETVLQVEAVLVEDDIEPEY
jgi:hypothetical protein